MLGFQILISYYMTLQTTSQKAEGAKWEVKIKLKIVRDFKENSNETFPQANLAMKSVLLFIEVLILIVVAGKQTQH